MWSARGMKTSNENLVTHSRMREKHMKYLAPILFSSLMLSNSASAELGAFKIECTQEYFGKSERTVFERSTKYEDKYFGMGIGPRAESPVAYKLVSAEIRNELYGEPFPEHLIVHFESIYREYDPDQESITVYRLAFFKGENRLSLVSATMSPDRMLLRTASNSLDDGSNFRNCISVGLW